MSNIKEIASMAGVSTGTVSVVLNGRADEMRISKSTQQRIFQAAKELDYHPNISARRLRKSGASNVPVIAVFWPSDIESGILGRFFAGVQNFLLDSENEFETLVQPFKKSELYKIKTLRSGGLFNGAILTGVSDSDIMHLEQNETKVPILLFNRTSLKYSTVCVDDYEVGRKTAELFISKGHKNIGFVMPDGSSKATSMRKIGFTDVLKAHGLEIAPGNAQYAVPTMEGGNIAAKRIISANKLPTAIFFSMDIMAVGAIPAFHDAGIRIPEDLEIMTYGDNEHSKFTTPSLSCSVLQVEKMAAACMNLMMGIINGKVNPPVSLVFETPFIYRQSFQAISENE